MRVLDAFRPQGATWSGQVISSPPGPSGGPSKTHLLPGGGVPRVHRARSPVPPRLPLFATPRSVTSGKANPYTWRTPQSTWESHRPRGTTTSQSQPSWKGALPGYPKLPGGTSCLRRAWHTSWKRCSTRPSTYDFSSFFFPKFKVMHFQNGDIKLYTVVLLFLCFLKILTKLCCRWSWSRRSTVSNCRVREFQIPDRRAQ